MVRGAYGKQLGHAFAVADTPSFTTRSFGAAEIAVTELKRDVAKNDEYNEVVPCQDAYILQVPVCDLPRRELFVDGRPVAASEMSAWSTAIFDLRQSYTGKRYAPYHVLSFYFPQRALDVISDLEGLPRVGGFDHNPVVGIYDPTIASLSSLLYPAFQCPDEANQVFIENIISAIAVHTLSAHGEGGRPRPLFKHKLSLAHVKRVKDALTSDDDTTTLASLAAECNLSPTQFHKAFIHATGLTPSRWLLDQRMKAAREQCVEGDAIADISRQSGLHSGRQLARALSGPARAKRTLL